jgi:hypothetical protein
VVGVLDAGRETVASPGKGGVAVGRVRVRGGNTLAAAGAGFGVDHGVRAAFFAGVSPGRGGGLASANVFFAEVVLRTARRDLAQGLGEAGASCGVPYAGGMRGPDRLSGPVVPGWSVEPATGAGVRAGASPPDPAVIGAWPGAVGSGWPPGRVGVSRCSGACGACTVSGWETTAAGVPAASEFDTGDVHGYGWAAPGVAGGEAPEPSTVVVPSDRCRGVNDRLVGCMLRGGVEADPSLPEARAVRPSPGETPLRCGCVAAGFADMPWPPTSAGLAGAVVSGRSVGSGGWAGAMSGPAAV